MGLSFLALCILGDEMQAMDYHVTTPSTPTELPCDVRVARRFGQALAHPLKGIARGP